MSLPDARDFALSRASILNEGHKGLLAVHGGAIAAMLAFMSQAAARSQTLLQTVFVALAVFAIGLSLALLVPYLRFINSKAAEERDRQLSKVQKIATSSTPVDDEPDEPHSPSRFKTKSWYAYTACQYLSIAAFLTGTSLVAYVGYTESALVHKTSIIACK
ncbi:MAG: hypothetical protein H7242_13540 [Microbacteriaceae bacterium]|nr:hypothetical protein [Burkholderiaceae bacterium]